MGQSWSRITWRTGRDSIEGKAKERCAVVNCFVLDGRLGSRSHSFLARCVTSNTPLKEVADEAIHVPVVPVAALTVASAPGLAHYLGLMQPIAKSDGFGAGFTEGVVPSIILSISVALAIAATNREDCFLNAFNRCRRPWQREG